jgi:hypothetical protein
MTKEQAMALLKLIADLYIILNAEVPAVDTSEQEIESDS